MEQAYWGSAESDCSLLSPAACGPTDLLGLPLGSPSGLTSRLPPRKPSLTAPAQMVFPHKLGEFRALAGCNLFWSLSAEALRHLWRYLL